MFDQAVDVDDAAHRQRLRICAALYQQQQLAKQSAAERERVLANRRLEERKAAAARYVERARDTKQVVWQVSSEHVQQVDALWQRYEASNRLRSLSVADVVQHDVSDTLRDVLVPITVDVEHAQKRLQEVLTLAVFQPTLSASSLAASLAADYHLSTAFEQKIATQIGEKIDEARELLAERALRALPVPRERRNVSDSPRRVPRNAARYAPKSGVDGEAQSTAEDNGDDDKNTSNEKKMSRRQRMTAQLLRDADKLFATGNSQQTTTNSSKPSTSANDVWSIHNRDWQPVEWPNTQKLILSE